MTILMTTVAITILMTTAVVTSSYMTMATTTTMPTAAVMTTLHMTTGGSTWDSRDNINGNNSPVLTYSLFLFDNDAANNHHSSNCGCGTECNTNDNSGSWNPIYDPSGD